MKRLQDAVLLLLICGFIATPRTNFVIADFWRWCVIHIWVQAFFEVFTTIIVGYLMVLMGLVDRQSVIRVVYIGALLFLGSGLLGISHNFYWNAKPVGTLAIGSVFSTLQVVPLILLTIEAWRFKKMPEYLQAKRKGHDSSVFAMQSIFLFLVGVNFWNFLGAGVFGLIINLPIINYYEHGTHKWNYRLLRTMFWSFNCGLALMVTMDLLPTGLYQFSSVDHGLAFARSQSFIDSASFQIFTWMRILSGTFSYLAESYLSYGLL